LEDYATQTWSEFSKSKPQCKKLDQSEFKLDSGIPCIRILADLGNLRMRAYFIKTDERIFMIMVNAPEQSKELEERSTSV